ncbi:NAD(P)H-binding protein [Nonomuraea sp. NPDC050540]|uniref:NAD(P)H-binding protein n=1 Tax=Nonomuraea sp. NPDC050540 TaxID=3364367 RepID=UPI0037A11B14
MILVTGGTGSVGGQVVAQLREQGVEARALTRDPKRPGEVYGDLTDPATLDAALDGVDKVFLVWPVLGDPRKAEAVAKIARPGRHVVYFSSAEAGAADPVNSAHGEMERLVRESGADWTFLRITGLATNDLRWTPSLARGEVARGPFGDWKRTLIHEADLAAAGVRVLLDPGHAGRTYVLTGPEPLDAGQRVRVLGEVLRRPLRFENMTREEIAALYGDFADALQDFPPERVTDTVEKLTGRPARTYREWAADHAGDFAGSL